MRKRSTIKMATYLTFLICGMLFVGINCALAEPVNIKETYNWRDIRGPNTVNYLTGDTLIFGARVEPAAGTTVEACQSGVCYYLYHFPNPVNPFEFSRAIPYNPALTSKWIITATNGPDEAVAETGNVGDVGSLSFVRNTQISGTGPTPTIKWDLPVGNTEPFTHVQLGFFNDVTNKKIFDPPPFSPSVKSYSVPKGILSMTGRYVVRVMLLNVNGTANNRSTTFINFRPLPEGGQTEVYFPVVDNGVFNFDFDVKKDEPVFIDPEIVIGYEYNMGVDDTVKFASVTLPEIGDNYFDIYLFDGSDFYLAKANHLAEVEYIFGSAGVDRFLIYGIEKSAKLDPNDVAAFITELTFTGTDQFTGTMTPINSLYDLPPSEIIGTWSSGIWYWDESASKWIRMTSDKPEGDIAAGDFTGDSIADVASIWPGGLWYQDGDTLAWTKIPGGPPNKVTAGDVTGDGRLEIIGTWSSGIWYRDVAASRWAQMTSSVTDGDIAAGDFTGDGKADVASCWSNGLWYQDGDTLAWTKITVNAPGGVPNRLAAGDVTGDGRLEIIGTWSSGIWYWDFVASIWTRMTASTPTGDIAAGDITGDGKADVASIWSSGLWYQDGATLDWTKVSNTAPTQVTAGDITGD